MTTIQVPPVLEVVPAVEGDPALLRGFVDDVLASAVNVDDLDTFARDSATLEGWTGNAADAYGRWVRHTAGDADAVSASLRRVARAVEDYAEDLTELRREHETLVDARTAYHAARADLLADVSAATVADAALVRDLHERAAELVSRREGLVVDVDALARDVAAAEQLVLDALASFATLDKARAAVTGATDVADAVLARPGSPTSGGSPADVAAWWDDLTPDERLAVLAAHPEAVGGADGIPADVRDRANRLLLETDLAALELREERGELLPADDRAALENGRAARAALAQGADEVDPVSGEALEPLLHLYDARAFGGDGRVAIAFGDPDTADHVSVMVPGLTSRATSAETNAEAAFNIYESARFADPYSTTASIMWIGYDAPSDLDSLTVAQERRAVEGGERLAQYVEGLRTSREGDPAHLTVVGHSYGSTTTAHAASDHGLDADDIVLVGSPGAGGGVDHASDLGVGADHVWAGNNSHDPVAMLADDGWVGGGTLNGAGMGNDVAEDDFGANRFRAESTTRGQSLNPFADHLKYFDPETESLFNIGQIVVGDDDEVLRADHTYDPWWWDPIDPERDRQPTTVRREEPEW